MSTLQDRMKAMKLAKAFFESIMWLPGYGGPPAIHIDGNELTHDQAKANPKRIKSANLVTCLGVGAKTFSVEEEGGIYSDFRAANGIDKGRILNWAALLTRDDILRGFDKAMARLEAMPAEG